MKKHFASMSGAARAAILLAVTATATAPALAHEGHGIAGAAHWHATDVLGFVAVAVLVGAVAWWDRRK